MGWGGVRVGGTDFCRRLNSTAPSASVFESESVSKPRELLGSREEDSEARQNRTGRCKNPGELGRVNGMSRLRLCALENGFHIVCGTGSFLAVQPCLFEWFEGKN